MVVEGSNKEGSYLTTLPVEKTDSPSGKTDSPSKEPLKGGEESLVSVAFKQLKETSIAQTGSGFTATVTPQLEETPKIELISSILKSDTSLDATSKIDVTPPSSTHVQEAETEETDETNWDEFNYIDPELIKEFVGNYIQNENPNDQTRSLMPLIMKSLIFEEQLDPEKQKDYIEATALKIYLENKTSIISKKITDGTYTEKDEDDIYEALKILIDQNFPNVSAKTVEKVEKELGFYDQ